MQDDSQTTQPTEDTGVEQGLPPVEPQAPDTTPPAEDFAPSQGNEQPTGEAPAEAPAAPEADEPEADSQLKI